MRELNEEPAPGEGAGLECAEPAVQAKPEAPSVYAANKSAASLLGVQAVFVFQPRPAVGVGTTIPSFLAFHAKRDVYFLLGEPKHHLSKKPRKDDMAGSRRLWVDLDPPPSVWDKKSEGEKAPGALNAWRAETLATLEAFNPPPSFVIDSGRGYWGLWQLDDLAGQEEVEAANMALARAFGDDGDSCHNIDRVARMPDTLNTKTGAKSKLAVSAPDRMYAISQFPKAEPRTPPRPSAPSGAVSVPAEGPLVPQHIRDLTALDAFRVPPKTRTIIELGHDPDNLSRFPSRSQALFYVCCDLCRRNVPSETILGLLLDGRFGITDSIFRRRDGTPVDDPQEYAERQIERARERVLNSQATVPADFLRNKDDKILPTQGNIRLAMQEVGVDVSYDTFQDRLLIGGLDGYGPLLDDRAMVRLRLLIDEKYRFLPAKEFFYDVVADTARHNDFHPVRDYLDGLHWDGVARIDRWLVAYGGATESDYVRAVGTLLLVAAVRRIRQPGVKFDEMPVLEGEQGTNKSSALAALAVNDEWFSDDLPLTADGKRVIEALAGRWIVEAAELKGMRKGEVEHLKAFLSRQIDRARMSYDRLVTEVPRQCVLVGTTNSAQYLRDGTGNRRFWPVRIGRFDLASLRRDRDQLWAEAVVREAKGASIRLDPALWSAAASEQQQRAVEDPYVLVLADFLRMKEGKIRASDVWNVLDIPAGQRTQEHNARLGEAMRALGWERKKLRFGGPPEYAYVRGDSPKELETYRTQEGGMHIGSGEPPF